MAKRGRTIPHEYVGAWWLRLARSVIRNAQASGRPLRTLGVELARHLDDRDKFDHGHLSKFASGALDPRTGEPYDVSLDLIEALCKEFRLPRPVFFARSYNEAAKMEAVAEAHDSIPVEEFTPEASLTPIPTAEERRRRKRSGAASAPVTNLKRAKSRGA